MGKNIRLWRTTQVDSYLASETVRVIDGVRRLRNRAAVSSVQNEPRDAARFGAVALQRSRA